MESIKFDLNQFLRAISFSLDFVEIDILGATANHSRRVAYISLRLAEFLGLSEAERSDLLAFAILHDNGLSEEVLQTDLEIRKLKQLEKLENFSEHCTYGERNVRHYPFRSKQKDIIKFHHESFNGQGFFGIRGQDIPLAAQIISLADFVDTVFHFEKGNKKKIRDYLKSVKNEKYSADLVDAFLETSDNVKFWYDLKNDFIIFALEQYCISNIRELSWQEIFEITRVFSDIIDSKSRFTGRHTAGIIDKAAIASEHFGFTEEIKFKFLIAASLHDLGKLAIPREILEKRGGLSRTEIELIQSHTYYTKFALSNVDYFGEIKEWAANHHERLNGNGYPEGLSATELDMHSRLMACIDIYQALEEDRPYRKGLNPAEIAKLMDKMVKNSAIDGDIMAEILPLFARAES